MYLFITNMGFIIVHAIHQSESIGLLAGPKASDVLYQVTRHTQHTHSTLDIAHSTPHTLDIAHSTQHTAHRT